MDEEGAYCGNCFYDTPDHSFDCIKQENAALKAQLARAVELLKEALQADPCKYLNGIHAADCTVESIRAFLAEVEVEGEGKR